MLLSQIYHDTRTRTRGFTVDIYKYMHVKLMVSAQQLYNQGQIKLGQLADNANYTVIKIMQLTYTNHMNLQCQETQLLNERQIEIRGMHICRLLGFGIIVLYFNITVFANVLTYHAMNFSLSFQKSVRLKQCLSEEMLIQCVNVCFREQFLSNREWEDFMSETELGICTSCTLRIQTNSILGNI